MSELQAFFAQNAVVEVTEEFVVSERFKDKKGPVRWKMKSITEEENAELRKASTRRVKGKNGMMVPEMNHEEYIARMTVASIVFPNLKDAELQKSYSVVGADVLLRKMLLPGEYGTLLQKVQQINGFDRDMNELVDEVKN